MDNPYSPRSWVEKYLLRIPISKTQTNPPSFVKNSIYGKFTESYMMVPLPFVARWHKKARRPFLTTKFDVKEQTPISQHRQGYRLGLPNHFPYVPGSKLLVLGMVIQPLIGNPYNGYINPYYWVDDHPYWCSMLISVMVLINKKFGQIYSESYNWLEGSD